MKISQAITMLKDIQKRTSPDEEIAFIIYDRDDAIEYIMNAVDDWTTPEDEVMKIFSNEYMQKVAIHLNQDDGVWQELTDSFDSAVEQQWKAAKAELAKSTTST